MESQNFIVSNFDLFRKLSGELLFLGDLLLEGSKHLVVLLTPLISFSHLLSPLVLVSENSFLHLNTSGIR
jgi:hypothetical protein